MVPAKGAARRRQDRMPRRGVRELVRVEWVGLRMEMAVAGVALRYLSGQHGPSHVDNGLTIEARVSAKSTLLSGYLRRLNASKGDPKLLWAKYIEGS